MALSNSYLRYSASIQLLASSCRILSDPIITRHLLMSLIRLPFKQYSAPSLTILVIPHSQIFFSSSFSVDFQQRQRLSSERQINLLWGSVFLSECFIIRQPFLRLQSTSVMDQDSELSSLFLEGEMEDFFLKQTLSSDRRISPKARESKFLILVILLAVLEGKRQGEEGSEAQVCINCLKSNNSQEIYDGGYQPQQLQNFSILSHHPKLILLNSKARLKDQQHRIKDGSVETFYKCHRIWQLPQQIW